MLNCFFILPGPATPPVKREANRFFFLGEFFSGSVVQPAWHTDAQTINSLDNNITSFKFHLLPILKLPSAFASILDIFRFVWVGYKNHRRRAIDAIVCYGLTKTGAAAYVLSKLLGCKLVVEVPGNPSKAFLLEDEKPSTMARLQQHLALSWSKFLLKRVDAIRCLYPEQLDSLNIEKQTKQYIFPGFVPVELLKQTKCNSKVIIFVGFPWRIKGLDILLQAFRHVQEKQPDYTLKCVGYLSDEEKVSLIEKYCNGLNVQFCKPVFWDQLVPIIADAKFLVLPSRTEAMGRVWVEAMGLGKPVICSRVDGIPYYIKHEENGLLFDSENVQDLATCVLRLIEDKVLYQKLSNVGFRYAHEMLDEHNYSKSFNNMLQEVCEVGVQQQLEDEKTTRTT